MLAFGQVRRVQLGDVNGAGATAVAVDGGPQAFFFVLAHMAATPADRNVFLEYVKAKSKIA